MNNLMRKKNYIGTKRGFTLIEILVSVIFVIIIIGATTYAWYASNRSFQSTEAISTAYGQARSLETMLQNAASTTRSLRFTQNPITEEKYSHFYFDDSGENRVYIVEFYGNTSVETPVRMDLDAIDQVTITIVNKGRRCLLKYKIESTDEKDRYSIDGGIILNNIDQAIFEDDNPEITDLPPVLNFLAPDQ